MNLHRLSLLGFAVSAAFALSACSSIDLDKDKDEQLTDASSLEQVINSKEGPLARKEVYFDFDSYAVDAKNMPVVTNHAKFLSANKSVKVRLEGNTDERGGREYNLALGQRRSEAVKQRLTFMGVSPDQIETISFGKEKPRALGHTEEDYSENRRVDIHYMLDKTQR